MSDCFSLWGLNLISLRVWMILPILTPLCRRPLIIIIHTMLLDNLQLSLLFQHLFVILIDNLPFLATNWLEKLPFNCSLGVVIFTNIAAHDHFELLEVWGIVVNLLWWLSLVVAERDDLERLYLTALFLGAGWHFWSLVLEGRLCGTRGSTYCDCWGLGR